MVKLPSRLIGGHRANETGVVPRTSWRQPHNYWGHEQVRSTSCTRLTWHHRPSRLGKENGVGDLNGKNSHLC